MTYSINKTDILKPFISVEETDINTNRDIVLFGRKRLEYGEQMNENLLHLLENYACPEDVADPGNPDLLQASEIVSGKKLLERPVDGQLWYNSTQERLFYSESSTWYPLPQAGDIVANWGVIAHGQQIPLPATTDGHVFTYSECSWMVSPFTYPDAIDFMECSTDDNANVTMQFSTLASASLTDGLATYLIVGIKGNVNLGDNTKPILSSPPLPSPTPTPTVTPSSTAGATVTPTPTVTSTPGASPTSTPAPSATPTSTPSGGVTPTPTPTNSPTNSPTPSVTPSNTPAPSVTPSTSAVTPISIQTTDYANPGANDISGVSAICDIANYNAIPDEGITNCGTDTFGSCALGECAPEPGDQASGAQMRVTVSGGVAPYTVRIKNISGNGSIPATECVDLGFPGGTNIDNSTSALTVISTFVIASDGGFQNAGAITGSCEDTLFFASGNFDIEVEDAEGTIETLTQSWSAARIDSGGI